MLPAHRLELADGWTIWRPAAVRGAGFPAAMLDKLVAEVSVLKLREKEVIFDEGLEALKFYMLLNGKILLEKRISEKITVSLGAIKPGYAFGWSAIFNEPYSFMAFWMDNAV